MATIGWICQRCKNVTLENYRTRAASCPGCGNVFWSGSVIVHKAPKPTTAEALMAKVKAATAG